jgi:hypothetical protein
MKCEKGDVAKIIMSLRPDNIGKTVFVEEYIGHLQQGEEFQFRGVLCKAMISDHYWWIVADYGLQNMLGDAPKAYIPDTWLEPLRPEQQKETESVKEDLTEKV